MQAVRADTTASSDNPQLRLAFDFVEHTGANVFLTGKAGTGKTTFLHTLKEKSPKRMIVVAPTGVAAINAGGVTIHSFFQMAFGPHLPARQSPDLFEGDDGHQTRHDVKRFSRNKINIIKSLDLLVIDEISMVRADLLDGIDEVLRRFRDRDKPFGGVQMLMIGDLQQLAPVAKDDEWNLLKEHYDTIFFFSSRALRQTELVTIELKHIYRQNDAVFIDLLNRVRENNIDPGTLAALNKRYLPEFSRGHREGYITLTTHNHQAMEINLAKLNTLLAKPHTFTASVSGEFPEYSYPTEYELTLKKGAQVMFVKNDGSPEKRYYNGKIGKITAIHEGVISVQCDGDAYPIEVECVEWQNTRYAIDEKTKEIQETVAGTFSQYPLKLAWAITIHKSQGLTFEKAVIDANAAFAHGQVYVALSRCKTLEGMVLSTPLSPRCIKRDADVSRFVQSVEQNQPGLAKLNDWKKVYQQTLLMELFEFSSIERRLFYCIKLANEHRSSLQEGFCDVLDKMNTAVRTDLVEISEKFKNQLRQFFAQQADVEENTALQDRVTKACAYFLQKTETILCNPLEHIEIESDNKTALKSVKNAFIYLHEVSSVKTACLKSCLSKFTVKSYLDARALAAIEKPEATAKRAHQAGEPDHSTSPHPELYTALKTWRNNKADELDMPAFMVAHQKTLRNIAIFLPATPADLLKVKGLGKRKVAMFGEEILEIIAAYARENNITVEPDDSTRESVQKPRKNKTKTEKTDSKLVTFNLFKSGKSMQEIAAIRGMAVSTIEGHLAHYVGRGELAIGHFVSPEKIAMIEEYYSSHSTGLAPAKAALGDAVSYGELQMVLCHLKAKGVEPAEKPDESKSI